MWRSFTPGMQVKVVLVFVVRVSPFLRQLDEPHVAEAEVDQILQKFLPDVVLNGLPG